MAQFNNISPFQSAKQLRRGTGDVLDEELKLAGGGGVGRRRSDCKEGWLRALRDPKLEVLAGACVRLGEIRRVGDVNGDVEEGLGGGFDDGDRGRRPDRCVLLDSGRAGEAAAEGEGEDKG